MHYSQNKTVNDLKRLNKWDKNNNILGNILLVLGFALIAVYFIDKYAL